MIKTKMMKNIGLTSTLALLVLACGNQEEIQPGPRFSLDGQRVGGEVAAQTIPSVQISARSTASWSQHLSNARHVQPNASMSAKPKLVAAVDLGIAGRKPVYGASAPLIVGDVVYHYDASGILHAVGLNGSKIWSRSLVPTGEARGDGFGGGLAFANGVIYAATGYGELVALRASNGGEMWRYRQRAPLRNAPLVMDGRVILISEGTQTVALNAQTGAQSWRHYSAQSSIPSRLNAGVPASANGQTVLSYATSELAIVNTNTGAQIWTLPALSDLFGGSKSLVGDITGDPVIADGKIYVGTFSGLAAVQQNSGAPLWTNRLGTKGPIIASGNSVFGLTTDERIYRLDAATGATIYARVLPKRVDGSISFSGKLRYFDPRLVNGELWLFDQRGGLTRVSASNGGVIERIELPSNLASTPVFGSGAMVAMSTRGQLLIFR